MTKHISTNKSSVSGDDNVIESDKSADESYWDAGRIVDAVAELAKVERGDLIIWITEDKSDPQWVKIKRFYSVMQAYGKSAANPIGDKIRIAPFSMMSATISPDKVREIESLLNEVSPCEETSEIIKTQTFHYFFTELFILYIYLRNTGNPFAGVMECSREVYNQLKSVETMIKVNLGPFEEKIKRLLVLLMGDDYDNPVNVNNLEGV